MGSGKRSAAKVLGLLGATGIVIASACAVYDSSLLVAADGGPSNDAGADVDLCKGPGWPQRPDKDDPSTGPDLEFYNALSFLDFNASPDAGATSSIGFNLDGFCTCPQAESCKPGDAAPAHCDGDGGLDNSGAALIRQFSSQNGFFDQTYINDQLALGVFGAVLRVRGYNGKPNDTKVELAVFISNGTEGIQQGLPQKPKFDGTDRWTLDPTALKGGALPDAGGPVANYEDPNAYVRDGVLVGTLNFPLSIGAGNGEGLVTIELSGSIVAAKLTADGASFKTKGIIGGRWPTRKLLTALQVLRDPLDKTQHLCGSDPIYAVLKDRVCGYADISSNLLEDGKNAPCDSLSIGFGFESAPATYSGTWPKPDSGLPCGPQWTDDCNQ